MKTYFADLHIHIGRDIQQKPVKITGSKNLTLTNILKESNRKGIDLAGIVDCHVPSVQAEIKQLLKAGLAFELVDGGIRYDNVTLILASEIEIYDEHCKGPIHVLCYLPDLLSMEQLSAWLELRMKNINLSSQRYYGSAVKLQKKIHSLEGLFIPAHIFTPFKSLYGKGVKESLKEVFDSQLINGVELGLSSDTEMVQYIEEIQAFPFLTSSDAHSLPKIAREYQSIRLNEASFTELTWALQNIKDRGIVKNYGMNPKLGKYYTTVCKDCLMSVKNGICKYCGSTRIVKGVKDRIQELSSTKPKKRHPSYIYQVPLEYIPKLGPKTYERLLRRFGTEMAVIHYAKFEELLEVIPNELARAIIANREGMLSIQAGGGGKYGSVIMNKE